MEASEIFIFRVSKIGSKHFKYLENFLSSELCRNLYHHEKLRKLQLNSVGEGKTSVEREKKAIR